MLDVSVVTLNYREALLTKRCIESLLKSKAVSFEIIVVDNSAIDSEKQILRTIVDKRVHIFYMKKNVGCAQGYNFGIKKAKGKYVFILNNDTEIFDNKALFKMKVFMDKNPKVGVVQPKIKSLTKPDFFEYAGAGGGYLDMLGYPFCRGRIFNDVEKDRGQYDTMVNVTWASTCAFFARKAVLAKAGLFDEMYFAYAEEVDISIRIWYLGFRVVFFPNTEVYHRGETSWKKIRGRKTFLIHRNHLILFFKCFPLKHILTFLPQRLLLELLSMVYYQFHKSNLHIFPVLLSYISVLVLLPKILYKRRLFFQDKKSEYVPLYQGSIVSAHFLSKKNRFTMLDRENFNL